MRVRLALASGEGRPIEVVALANAGYEAESPELALPTEVASRLGLRRKMKAARRERYLSAAGAFTVAGSPTPSSLR